jgi:hypothetical protein
VKNCSTFASKFQLVYRYIEEFGKIVDKNDPVGLYKLNAGDP